MSKHLYTAGCLALIGLVVGWNGWAWGDIDDLSPCTRQDAQSSTDVSTCGAGGGKEPIAPPANLVRLAEQEQKKRRHKVVYKEKNPAEKQGDNQQDNKLDRGGDKKNKKTKEEKHQEAALPKAIQATLLTQEVIQQLVVLTQPLEKEQFTLEKDKL